MINYLHHFTIQSVKRNNGIFKVLAVNNISEEILLLNTKSECFRRGQTYRVELTEVGADVGDPQRS